METVLEEFYCEEQHRAGESRREEERGGYSQVGITWMMQRDDTPLRNSLTDAGEGRMKQRDRTEEKVRLLFQDNKKKKRETEGSSEDEEKMRRDLKETTGGRNTSEEP